MFHIANLEWSKYALKTKTLFGLEMHYIGSSNIKMTLLIYIVAQIIINA